MEYISVGGYVYFLTRREDHLWDSSSCRAFNALDMWRVPIGCASDEASLRLPPPFIPYIMGALLLIFPISFLLIFERENVALSFINLFSNYVTYCIAALEAAPPRKTTYQ